MTSESSDLICLNP